jgi:transposase-like protein
VRFERARLRDDGVVLSGGSSNRGAWQTLGDLPVRTSEPVPQKPRRRARQLTPAQRQALIDRYIAGERAHRLAAAFDVDRDTVASILTRAGVRRARSLTTAEVQECVRLYVEESWSLVRIAEHVGRHQSTVWLALKKQQVKMRPPTRSRQSRE